MRAFILHYQELSKKQDDGSVKLGTRTFTKVRVESEDSDPHRRNEVFPVQSSKALNPSATSTQTLTLTARESTDKDAHGNLRIIPHAPDHHQ